jgi:hypothetical protein
VVVAVIWGEELFDRDEMLLRIQTEAETRGLGTVEKHVFGTSHFTVSPELHATLQEERAKCNKLCAEYPCKWAAK